MQVKIKKIHPEAVIPTYATYGDACFDLTAISVRRTATFIEYDFGLAMEIPYGYFGLMRPRSSVSKTGLVWKTSGVIDSGYRGSLVARFEVVDDLAPIPEVGERVAQIVILPYPQIEFEEVEELSTSVRGEGGFGSTGKN